MRYDFLKALAAEQARKAEKAAEAVSPERQLMHAQADNRQLIDAMVAIVDTAEATPGAQLIKQIALIALARSAMTTD